jgi:spermidine/putrescine transport system ATP-binding protein
MSVLELDGVAKRFGSVTAVDGVSLSVDAGELVCLLGPSGCGKSTTLRTVAGFERPTAGTVRIEGRDVTAVPPNRRPCAMVFQDWALFPNKTVRENVAFGLKTRGVGRTERRERADELLALVEMTPQADARPAALSGGQKQRVALARALAPDPDLLLLDEPLSNLDRKLRETMQLEIKEIQAELGTTMLYVTHDQDEAFTLADRIGVMNEGRLVQAGPPAAVYTDPDDRFVESFLGSTNFVECTVAGTQAAETPTAATDGGDVDGRVRLDTPLGVPLAAPAGDGLAPGDRVTASLRPERLSVAVGGDPAPDGTATPRAFAATGTVAERLHRGSSVRYELAVGDATLFTERRMADRLGVEPGAAVTVWCDGADVTYFDAAGDRLR